MAAKSKIDYDRIERGWREGILSPRQLAEEYTHQTGQAVSHAAIIKHFRKLGINRDLNKKIQEKANAIVTQSMVTDMVTPVTAMKDKEIVESASIHVANVKIAQRKDIGKARSLANSLLEELEHQTINREEYESLGILLRSEDEKGMDKLNDLYMKAMSTPSRIISMQKLADTMKTLIGLEREAFGIDKEVEQKPDALGDLLKTLTTTNANSFSVVNNDPEY